MYVSSAACTMTSSQEKCLRARYREGRQISRIEEPSIIEMTHKPLLVGVGEEVRDAECWVRYESAFILDKSVLAQSR